MGLQSTPQPEAARSSAQTAAKPSILAWWAILPTFLWGAAAWRYAWPLAVNHATKPQAAPSYFIGQLIAGPLVGLIIGWIAYRALRRSQLAGSIAYTLVCLAMSAGEIQRYRVETAARQIAPQIGAAQTTVDAYGHLSETFPVYGVALQSPPGWRQLEPDRLGIVARWASANSTPADLRGLIMVEVLKPTTPDGKVLAGQYAKQWKGKLLDGTVTLDGEMAWQIQAQPSPNALEPVAGIICVDQGRLYFISAGVMRGETCQEQVDFIRKSWHWIPPESPVDHLQFRDTPMVALNGQLSVSLPGVMRTFSADDPQHRFGVECYDFKNDSRAMNIVFTLGDSPAGVTLSAAEQRLSVGIQQQYHLPEAFTWRKLPDSHGFNITQPIPGPKEDGPNWIMWGIAQFGQSKMAMVNIAIYAQDPASRAKYIEAAEKIVKSIELKSR